MSFESKAKSDWSALFSQGAAKSAPSALNQEILLSLKADWFMAVVSQAPDQDGVLRYVLVNRLIHPEVSLLHNEIASSDQDQELMTRLSQDFYTEVTQNGQVLSLQSDPGLTEVEKNILRWVVSHFETVFPEKIAENQKEWITTEYDPHGQYEANYHILSASRGVFQIEKDKSKYLELNASRPQKKRRFRREFNLSYQIDTDSKMIGRI